jgi:hypothetical protein
VFSVLNKIILSSWTKKEHSLFPAYSTFPHHSVYLLLCNDYLFYPLSITIWNSKKIYCPLQPLSTPHPHPTPSTFPEIAASAPHFAHVQVKPLFKFGPNVRAIKLPPKNFVEVTGAKARVSGWGHRSIVQPSAAVMSQNKFLAKWKPGRQEVSHTILLLLLGRGLFITVHSPGGSFTFPHSWFWEFCSSGLLICVEVNATYYGVEKENSVFIFHGRHVVEDLWTLKDAGAIVPFV